MCLIALNWEPDSPTPLILLANRDEYYQRPASKAQFWHDSPAIFGGRDLRAGGTWLAVSQQGRLAAITNYRELENSGVRSRGELTSGFLASRLCAQEYLQMIAICDSVYAGFNLLLADHTGLWYYSNRDGVIRQLKPGLCGLSNGLLNTPWPKVRRLKKHLRKAIEQQSTSARHLLQILHDNYRPPDNQLPDTGIDTLWERMLAPCFIASPEYGTRNSAALILHSNGQLHWHERYYGPGGTAEGSTDQILTMPEQWLAGMAYSNN